MGGRSSVTRRIVGSVASVALVVTAFVWIAAAPGAGAGPSHPDLSAHQRRYEQRFQQLFRKAPANVRLAAQRRYQEAFLNSWQPAWNLAPQGETPCVNGHAGPWPCKGFDLLSYLPMSALGGGESNDVWGWTDPLDGKEYAILGRTNGTAFVDISDPTNPVYLGNLPSWQGYESSWRAIKVYRNYAYIVADAIPHGMQVFDLTKLRNVTNPPVTFTADFHYDQMSNTHTLAVNEETGYLYAVGTNTCSGGLHMIDVHTNPARPRFAGCFSSDGYVHETQCVVYHGPDVTYQGHEVCFAHDEDTVTIIDVTDKTHPRQISRTPYSGSGYTHQGWLTADQRTLVVNDELDEIFQGHNAWTRFFNVSDLDLVPPPVVRVQAHPNIDHNLYIVNKLIYQSDYRAGLRVFTGKPWREVAYFDVYPDDDLPEFNGSWNNYPFFSSGVIVLDGIEQGLFLLRPTFSTG
jgi:choice-of-anchor B domain-containing protein